MTIVVQGSIANLAVIMYPSPFQLMGKGVRVALGNGQLAVKKLPTAQKTAVAKSEDDRKELVDLVGQLEAGLNVGTCFAFCNCALILLHTYRIYLECDEYEYCDSDAVTVLP
jgi:hypothetical protein